MHVLRVHLCVQPAIFYVRLLYTGNIFMSTVCVGFLFLLDKKVCIDELIFHNTAGMQLNKSLIFELCI
jgi:hypothetical protein